MSLAFAAPRLAALVLMLVLAGCAHYAPPPSLVGKSVQEVQALMGPPTEQRPDRLVYARGPMGEHTWFLWLDDKARVQATEQRLQEAVFMRVAPGMTQEAVLDLLGPVGERRGLGRERGQVWSWRFENGQCLWFQVEMDAQGRVRNAGYGLRPECDAPEIEQP
jgi:hypothetical protein